MRSSDPMDNAINAADNYSREISRSTTSIPMALLVIAGLIIAQFYVLGVIERKQDETSAELQKLSACKLSTSVLSNPETRYQGVSIQHGRES
jgi:hypothetical protein